VDSVLQRLRVDPQAGLSEAEVRQRCLSVGPNTLDAPPERRVLSILAAQFSSLVVALLGASALLAFLFGELPEAVAILVVIAVNGAIGFVSEWRALRSMAALRSFTQIISVVLREGLIRPVPAVNLVPGDIVQLEAGDLVPADLRIIELSKLETNESTLTGESMPVSKNSSVLAEQLPVFDRRNMLFKGTSVTHGRGRGVVVATGAHTEFGKIFAQVSRAEAPHTPLEKRLDALGERLAIGVLVIAGVIAFAGIAAGREVMLAIEVAIALAVAAVPEGLPIVATIALARGMWRMARRRALITRLSAVETLGATSVILTDKTGTLTENRMTVTTALLPLADVELDNVPDVATGAQLDALLKVSTLCNDASLQRATSDTDPAVGIGDPTEIALLQAAAGRGLWRDELLEDTPEVFEDPFDPDSKRMATIHSQGDAYLIAVKGAPEVILPLCSSARLPEGTEPLPAESRGRWLERVEELCDQGLRTLAVAEKVVDRRDSNPYEDLVLRGVVGMEDPARDGIAEAICRCHRAGIDVVMVTGDHAKTARSIAEDVQIVAPQSDPELFLEGTDVAILLNESRQQELLAARVFTRVTPQQKYALIDLYQRSGQIVAMTGDGVNDAPALKKADIGVAMGQRGTAVAREAAAMILQDDDFGTIVAAIDHGRAIFDNIRKFVVYLLSCNISEILIVSLATLVGAPLPLMPLQILFLNLVTDVFPALALGVGPGRSDLMNAGPRPADERILLRRHWIEISLFGLIMAAAVLAAMAIAHFYLHFDNEQSVTVAFCTLAVSQLWHVFNMRGDESPFFVNEITRNVWIWLALLLCLVLIAAAFVIEPIRVVLQLRTLSGAGWIVILLASTVTILTNPVVKRLPWIADQRK